MEQYAEIIQQLKSQADAKNAAGMARFAIQGGEILGISIYTLRSMAKHIGHDHSLAAKLWDSGIHEARILAGLVEEPDKVTDAQLESWVGDFNSWDIVDQLSALIAQTPHVIRKIHEWAIRDEEFVKRAAFSLIAEISFYHTHMQDAEYEQFFPLIIQASTDERNFVKKAVNWALRNIGKRNISLNKRALETAAQIKQIDSKAARWIASDAIRELSSSAIQQRIAKRK
ncbi:MAG: DNA alkylation repair protein [Dehalococcoidia bacterium]|nr:DNA alkylation repair protein [Dehalococcoidia bacterium]